MVSGKVAVGKTDDVEAADHFEAANRHGKPMARLRSSGQVDSVPWYRRLQSIRRQALGVRHISTTSMARHDHGKTMEAVGLGCQEKRSES